MVGNEEMRGSLRFAHGTKVILPHEVMGYLLTLPDAGVSMSLQFSSRLRDITCIVCALLSSSGAPRGIALSPDHIIAAYRPPFNTE